MRVCLISLGCPKNLVDGETLLGQLAMAGHEIAAEPELAEAVVVNTCAFIQAAQQESMQVIREIAARRRGGGLRLLVVAGCLAQRRGHTLLEDIPEIDGVLGTGAVGDAAAALARMEQGERVSLASTPPGFLPQEAPVRLASTPPWRAYIKVTEGCSNRCAYCLIPGLRGPARSREPAMVAAEARLLAAAGVRELTLVGQDLTRYGLDLPDKPGLGDLIPLLAGVDNLRWIRLHYLHPARLTRELLAAMAAEPRICRYLDVPMQHGDDRVLAGMNRGTTREELVALVADARAALPGVSLRTSLIVGFPGETEAAYGRLLTFMREIRADYAGVFAYSRQPGTPAALLPGQVPGHVKVRRRARALALQRRLSAAQNELWVGRQLETLIESGPHRLALPDGGEVTVVSGRSHREAPDVDGQVHVFRMDGPRAPLPSPGSFVQARVVAAGPYDLYCEEVDEQDEARGAPARFPGL